MARAGTKTSILKLRLYVAGNGPNSVQARANLATICKEQFNDAFELEIVDILDSPLRALADGIVVTPTLLRLAPLPVQRIIGTLRDSEQVLLALHSA